MATCPIHVGVNSISECRHTFQQVKKCLDEIHGGSVAGMTSFLNLSDVMPFETTYAGKANWFPQVNATATGLEFHNLFGVSNTWTVQQTIQDAVNLDPSQDARISRNGVGVLMMRGDNRLDFYTQGSIKLDITPVGGLGAYMNFVAGGTNPRLDWSTTPGSLLFQGAAHTTQLTVNDSGVTVGTLTGYIKGTAGLLSATATIPASDITGLTDLIMMTPTRPLPHVHHATDIVVGVFPITRGGTGQTTQTTAFDALSPLTTLGDTLYHDGTDNVRLAGNITTTRKFMRQTGDGAASAAPAWDTILSADISDLTATLSTAHPSPHTHLATDIVGSLFAMADHNHTGVGDGGVLTNDLHDGYMQVSEIADPSNPPQDSVRLYTRPSPSLGSGYTEILIRSSVGTECVMCTVLDFLHANTLIFNDIEP